MNRILYRAVKIIAKIIIGFCLSLAVGEGLIRLATSSQDNYVIEMWRYANELKQPTPGPLPGHEHRPGSSAELQGVSVRINDLGLRGPNVSPQDLEGKRLIVLLGDSITFGWGVEEDQTLSSQLSQALGPDTVVMNAGIGNMNFEQLAARWKDLSSKVHPDLLIVLPGIRAGEAQVREHGSWLVRDSQLFALGSVFYRQITSGASGRDDLTQAYRDNWTKGDSAAAFHRGVDQLAALQARDGYPVLVAMFPETHDFISYDFDFATEIMRAAAVEKGWDFVDLYPLFKGENAADFWVSRQDIHLNGSAFKIISAKLAEIVGPKQQ
jgi:lysophospholipase L1-like esterase